ncbi:BTAD domain-containing putative transcriptional regulator [Streptomyces goshikiensis]|uniref:BTAD domain-containing putative transcriptional regulator n=1 Tax=Streptomyces goshikiensis TaxID=1942 RepID=UPI0036869954
MQFRILGPLEVTSGGRRLALGGFKQRAVLGLLLLRPNQVVATSELLGALWPDESRPMTARKIVQNAVSGLRTALSAQDTHAAGPHGGAHTGPHFAPPELITRAPGYLLRVDPAHLDMRRFEDKAAAGRAKLAEGGPVAAAELLREALAEWRGPALADLMEQGVDWPEVSGLRQLRLDAMEYRFEAELACGRHHTVLGELNSLAEAEPLRERLSGQLMLALYRCGRQAEALNVFSRVRRALVEDHGLEPSRDLQALQQRILHHDRELTSPVEAVSGPVRLIVEPQPPGDGQPDVEHPYGDHPYGDHLYGEHPAKDAVAVDARAQSPSPARASGPLRAVDRIPPQQGGGGASSRRRDVCVLLVRVRAGTAGAAAPEQVDGSLSEAAAALAENIDRHGGTVVGSLGHLTAALFGLRDDWSGAPLAAVRAAFAVRDQVHGLPGLSLEAVVTTGRALVREDSAGAVSVVGTLLDTAQHLLSDVPPGKIHVSADVAADSAGRVRYREVSRDQEGTARVHEACALYAPGGPARGGGTPHDREHELSIVTSHLGHSRHHHAPYMVTVLGDRGVGKTRFLAEFQQRVRRLPEETRILRLVAPEGGGHGLRDLTDALLGAWGAATGAPPGTSAEELMTDLVRGAAGTGATAERLLRALPVSATPFRAAHMRAVMDAWTELLVLCARQVPLVLCLDGLQLADDAVLDWLEELVTTVEDAPLLVVACARPQLLARRPLWAVGRGRTSTLSLAPLPGPTAAPLRMASGEGLRRPAVGHRTAEAARASRGPVRIGMGRSLDQRMERRMAR